ncbi:MAG: sulfotransferase domain-containing protein, partial [Gammaproteobacteria bacterium]
MLLVCNGARKSGSTWLYNILTSLVACEEPDARFLTGNTRNPCLRPDMLEEFLGTADFDFVDYITKNHLAGPEFRDMLLARQNVYVFDIERDPKDVAVSLYYDACNRHGYGLGFDRFYWSEGREKIAELSAYHGLWRQAGPRCHVASYEGLKNGFAAEVRAIAGILGIALSDDEIDRLREKTSMESLRSKYADQDLYKGERFFRKGL